MKFHASGYSDVGRVRDNNEDSFLVDEELGLFIVCDGLGGHAAGETASKKAVEVVADDLRALLSSSTHVNGTRESADNFKIMLRDSVQHACSEIYKIGQANEELTGMGTTLTLLVLSGNKGFMAHVGDSRLYLVRGGEAQQLSRDHTLLSAMEEKSGIVLKDAQNSYYSHVLTRCLGQKNTVQVDTLSFDVLPGDLFLMCSDGYSGCISSNDELLKGIGQTHIKKQVENLVERAKDADGSDNITVLLVDVEDEELGEDAYKRVEEIERRIETLKNIYLFQQLELSELVRIMELVRVKDCKDGDVLVYEEEVCDAFYIVLDGALSVRKGGKDITELHPGQFIGEIGLLTEKPRAATIKAVSNSRVMVLRKNEFSEFIEQDPKLGVKLLLGLAGQMSETLGDATEMVTRFYSKS